MDKALVVGGLKLIMFTSLIKLKDETCQSWTYAKIDKIFCNAWLRINIVSHISICVYTSYCCHP